MLWCGVQHRLIVGVVTGSGTIHTKLDPLGNNLDEVVSQTTMKLYNIIPADTVAGRPLQTAKEKQWVGRNAPRCDLL
jgi:hypothetical protein